MLVMSHHHTTVQLANCSILQDQRQRSFCLRSRSVSADVLRATDDSEIKQSKTIVKQFILFIAARANHCDKMHLLCTFVERQVSLCE